MYCSNYNDSIPYFKGAWIQMIYETFGFGLMVGMLIGSLSYLLMHKMIVTEYDKRYDNAVINFAKHLDKRQEEGEEVLEDG